MVICHLDFSISLLICTHPNPSPLTVVCKAQEWFLKNLRPHQSSPSPFHWSDRGYSFSVLALTPLILTPFSCLFVLNPLGISAMAPALAPPSVRSSLSGSAWAPPLPLDLLTSALSRALPQQCGLTSLLHSPSPWAASFHSHPQYLHSGCFPYHPSPTMERNSRSFVYSQLNSLIPNKYLFKQSNA